MIKLRIKYPFNELYWLLISKGYKTYLLLANNYYVYYPNIKDENQHLSEVVEHYCENSLVNTTTKKPAYSTLVTTINH